MDKQRFFAAAGYRCETFGEGKQKFEIRELSLAQRRAVLAVSEKEYPSEVVAAYTVALSCPDFTEDDVERLVEDVRPDILLAASARIFQLSGMVGDAKAEAKKPSESTRSGSLLAVWRSLWAKRLAS